LSPEPEPRPGWYEVRLSGTVHDDAVLALGDRACHPEVGTVLTARVRDQPALHGLLNHLRAAGAEVLEVRRVIPRTP
jgi:hypothetical protein